MGVFLPRISHIIIDKLSIINLTKGYKKMALSKKHFEAVAKIINDHNFNYNNEPEDVVLGYSIEVQDNKRKLVNSFIEYFKTQNKNFDSIKFYNACNQMKGGK